MDRKIVLTGTLLIVLSVILGAFGAHGLKAYIDDYGLKTFEKGTDYQMYVGVSLLVLGLSTDKLKFDLKWFYRILTLGIIIFSCYFTNIVFRYV